MRASRSWSLIAAVVVAGVVMVPQPASASCAQDAGPGGSSVVFVGSAQEERRGYTRFHVDRVVDGPDLAPDVWVRSGQEQPPWPRSLLSTVGSSGDADLTLGRLYVVGADRHFVTDACLVASEVPRAERSWRAPTPSGLTGADPPVGPIGWTLWTAALVLTLWSLVARRAGRSRRGTPPPSPASEAG